LAQPLNKWIEELQDEIESINEQLRARALELQNQDTVFNEFLRKKFAKEGALNYLQNKLSEQKPKEKKKRDSK